VNLSAFLYEYPLFLKHPKWSEEKEWRLVRTWPKAGLEQHLEEIDFHQRRDLWVPHINLQVQFKEQANQELHRVDRWCLPLTKVIVGPGIDFPMAQESIRLMLRKYGMNPDYVAIEQSQVPLRTV